VGKGTVYKHTGRVGGALALGRRRARGAEKPSQALMVGCAAQHWLQGGPAWGLAGSTQAGHGAYSARARTLENTPHSALQGLAHSEAQRRQETSSSCKRNV